MKKPEQRIQAHTKKCDWCKCRLTSDVHAAWLTLSTAMTQEESDRYATARIDLGGWGMGLPFGEVQCGCTLHICCDCAKLVDDFFGRMFCGKIKELLNWK